MTHETVVRGRDRRPTWDDVDAASRLGSEQAWKHYRAGYRNGRRKGRRAGIALGHWLVLRKMDRDRERAACERAELR